MCIAVLKYLGVVTPPPVAQTCTRCPESHIGHQSCFGESAKKACRKRLAGGARESAMNAVRRWNFEGMVCSANSCDGTITKTARSTYQAVGSREALKTNQSQQRDCTKSVPKPVSREAPTHGTVRILVRSWVPQRSTAAATTQPPEQCCYSLWNGRLNLHEVVKGMIVLYKQV